jgi:hypothetical protein
MVKRNGPLSQARDFHPTARAGNGSNKGGVSSD